MIETEYALTKLDELYYDKIKRNYTPALAAEISGEMRRRLKSLESLTEDELESAVSSLSVENFRDMSRNTFSRNYQQLNQFKGILLQYFSGLSEGVKEEYLSPFLKNIDTMESIINEIRKKSDEKFPEDLTLGDVEQAMYLTVGGKEGYFKFNRGVIDSFIMFSDLLESQGIDDPELLVFKNLLTNNKEFILKIHERIF